MTTEKRLIYANELKTLFDERYDDAFMQSHTRPNIAYWEGYSCGVNWGRNTIAEAPTVDPVEVVHGRWIETFSMAPEYNCSECGQTYEWFEVSEAHYCPHCGAKMYGDGNG